MQPVVTIQLHRLTGQLKKNNFRGKLLVFDPGETTGWAFFECSDIAIILVDAGQITTWPLDKGVEEVTRLVSTYCPDFLVYESYHVYDWKLDQHSFQEVPTIQVIGMIKTICIQSRIRYHTQNAQTGKGFCKDEKLKQWGIYIPNLRHAMDAVRHGAHFILFGLPKI